MATKTRPPIVPERNATYVGRLEWDLAEEDAKAFRRVCFKSFRLIEEASSTYTNTDPSPPSPTGQPVASGDKGGRQETREASQNKDVECHREKTGAPAPKPQFFDVAMEDYAEESETKATSETAAHGTDDWHQWHSWPEIHADYSRLVGDCTRSYSGSTPTTWT